MMDKTEAPTKYVTKVAIKLPDFWTDLWFLHAEAAFRNAQITQSKTKFDHIIQKLPQKIMVSVRGLIMVSAASSATPFLGWETAALLLSWTPCWLFSQKMRHQVVCSWVYFGRGCPSR